jgi:peptide/nickel transport system substrate-binding protein
MLHAIEGAAMKVPFAKRLVVSGLGVMLTSSLAIIGLGSNVWATNAAATTNSGNVTFALPPATVPNYIFPVFSGAQDSIVNVYQMQQIMFRTLYYFGIGVSPAINLPLSLAAAPTFSNGGRTATIKLKKYQWSDGQPVTSRDVVFFINLLRAQGVNWANYGPGGFPGNVTTVSAPNASTLVLTFNKVYSSTWILYNELSQITPLPQHAWDKESAQGAIGNYDQTPAGAKAVLAYLTKQAESLQTYATNPLWQIVDGPFKLKTYQPTGYSVYVPNARYSGPIKPKITSLTEVPFTTDAAEFNALRSGSLDYGYIPPQDATQVALLKAQGYGVSPWVGWSVNYFPINYNNPTVGPIFKQLYIRQALQEMVNQPVDITKALYGYGYPTYGPVPSEPKNLFVSSQESTNPYPFSPSNSAKLLKSHGWNVKPGSLSTCVNPGTAANQCGQGIAKGAKLAFNLQYVSGLTYTAVEMQQWKSSLSQDGIQLSLTTAPFNTIITNASPCKVGPSCTWQMENWGGGWTYGPNFEPTGEVLFQSGGGFNEGNYSDPVNDANVVATHTVSGLSTFFKYEDYLAKQLPVIWQPNPDYQISAIRNGLKGVTQSPEENFTPENWTFTS